MRSLRQGVSLSLHPDDVGEVITHSAELKGHPMTDGLYIFGRG